MLIKPRSRRWKAARANRGIVLIVALIMLVALSLAGIALTRSVSTTNIIAGNLSFQQAATHSADVGTETAVAWLTANVATLDADNPGAGYLSYRLDPAANVSWHDFWNATFVAPLVTPITLPSDASGNTVSYVIQRLCNGAGQPVTAASCSASPIDTGSSGNSQGAGVIALASIPQVYYRITARVAGARNTLSYTQVVVAL